MGPWHLHGPSELPADNSKMWNNDPSISEVSAKGLGAECFLESQQLTSFLRSGDFVCLEQTNLYLFAWNTFSSLPSTKNSFNSYPSGRSPVWVLDVDMKPPGPLMSYCFSHKRTEGHSIRSEEGRTMRNSWEFQMETREEKKQTDFPKK